MAKTVQTVRIAPYQEIAVAGDRSIALVNGNVPHLFLRIGSESVRLLMGQCLPLDSNFVRLVNPFPRSAEVTIGRDWDLILGSETNPPRSQAQNIESMFYTQNAGSAGLKYAVGVMVKRGTAYFDTFDALNDGFGSMIIFPRAKRDFLSFKPVGAMTDATVFRYMDGAVDDAITCVSGTYTDADVAAWVAAAGYAGQVSLRHSSLMNNQARYEISDDFAAFYVRDVGKAVNSMCRITHRGARLEDYR